MKRWNGWGLETTSLPLPASARAFLVDKLGASQAWPDATLEQVCRQVSASRLAAHPLIQTDAVERVRHARGQSLPDWIALRSGQIPAFPDGVAYPTSDAEALALLTYARDTGAKLIPYGGGSSVVGHINPIPGDAPTLTVDMTRLDKLLTLDETSYLATFEAGVFGPQLEAQLRERGYRLGHYPQSFECSTLGGWVAARSSGQQSYYYGRIEDLLAGAHIETPLGALDLPPHPASAAGPDVRQMVLGSEGRLGLITRATVRVRRVPETESFHAIFFRDWDSGVNAMRALAQSAAPISMLRLSDADETETTLKLAGHERLVAWAERGLRLAGYGAERCLLIFGVTGERASTQRAIQTVVDEARDYGGLPVGETIGKRWQKTRFLNPYLRNTLWETGYAIDTLETAMTWTNVKSAATSIKAALRDGLADVDERVLVFAHLSHVYSSGASIYVTYLYRRVADPEKMLRWWDTLKTAASRAIVAHGGTISHQHGVGTDHAPYLEAEKGRLGMVALKTLCETFDPDQIMNPGKLLATDGRVLE